MSEFESIFASTTGELECGCTFDQHGVIAVGDWRHCADHASPVRVTRARTWRPPVIGEQPREVTTRVRILLNPDPLAAWCGYRPGVPVHPVFTYLATGSDHMWLREQAWQVGNYDGHPPADVDPVHEPGAESDAFTARLVEPQTRELAADYRRRADRSLRTGDVVAIDGDFYACAGLGWEPIDTPFITHEPVPADPPVDLADALSTRALPDLLDDAA